MFNAKELRELRTAKDFKPFAIHTTDGVRHEIHNHDMMMVSQNSVYISLQPNADGFAERYIRRAIIHITRIEELQAA
jgi:hypothetical protein